MSSSEIEMHLFLPPSDDQHTREVLQFVRSEEL